jgi:hypothetical protein
MRAGRSWPGIALLLAGLPLTAHAQHIPPWVVVGALSPIVVLLLCALLGWLARSARLAALHAAMVLTWVVLFSLASRFVENDYVIWTPLALYLLHAALLTILVVVRLARRMTGGGDAA